MGQTISFKAVLTAILLMTAVFALGLWLGRSSVRTTEVVRYVPGETVEIEVPVNVYIESEPLPAEIRWIYRDREILVDNIIEIIQEVDTLAILRDWTLRREFTLNV